MEHKFQVGDRIRFTNRDAIAEAIGTIADADGFGYGVFVEQIISPTRPIRLHTCGGRFPTPDYWNIYERDIVELIDDAGCAEVSPDDLEVLLNG